VTPPLALPALLRYLREKNGLSQAGLAERLCMITRTRTITRHDISRYERGKRTPEAWLPALATALGAELHVLETAAAVHRLSLADPAHQAAALAERRHIDASLARGLADLLADTRRLEDQVGSAVLVRTVTAQADLAGQLAKDSRGQARTAMTEVAAGWEQFTGWLYASTGDHANAIARYRTAQELAEEAGDHDMISTAVSMRGQVAWMAADTAAMIGLTQAARRDPGHLSPSSLA
jgi:transcriptional regulator with XRE-family HTH domain